LALVALLLAPSGEAPTTHSTNREPNELEQKKGGQKIDKN
jgi:hypothetical protein